MTVSEDSREFGILDPHGRQIRTAAQVRRVVQLDLAAQLGQGRGDFLNQISAQFRLAVRLLTFGRDCHPARKIGQEGSAIEVSQSRF